MKNKKKLITMIIAAALVVSLALCIFVACGETVVNGTTNGNASAGSTLGGPTDGTTGGSSTSGPSTGGPSTSAPTGGPSTGGSTSGPTGGSSTGGSGFVAPSTAISSDEYFDKFNELTSDFGKTAIEQGSDLYFHSEMSGLFGLKREDGELDESFELGFEIEAILDRTSQDADGEYTSQNSAIRARVFSGAVDILAASFFVDDPLSLYIDFAGSHIKLSAEFLYEGTNLNELLGRAIGKALNKEFDFDFGSLDFSISLNKVLDAIVEGTGSEWSPTVLLKSLANLIGIDMGDDGAADEVDPQDEVDSQYDFSYFEELLSDTFNATQNGDDYSIIFDSRDTNEFLHFMFGGILGVEVMFKMNFSEQDGRLKDGVRFELGLPELLTPDERYPYVGLRVNLLELAPASGREVCLPVSVEEYKGNIAFKTEEAYTPSGFKLFGSELRELRYSEAFMFDFVNPLATNNTAAQIKLTMANEELSEDVLFELSFVRGRLALKLDPAIIFKEGTLIGDACRALLDFALGKLKEAAPELEATIADALYVGGAEGARAEINGDFKGVTIENVGVREILDGVGQRVIDAYKAYEDAPAPEYPEQGAPEGGSDFGGETPDFSDLQNFMPSTIMKQRILPALGRLIDTVEQLGDGVIRVHSDDIFGLLLDVANDLAGNYYDRDRVTADEIFDEAIEMTAKALDWLAEKGYIAYDDETPDAYALMDSAFETLFDIFEIKDMPEKSDEDSFAKYALKTLLLNMSFDFSIDLRDGWHYSFGIGIAGATLTYSHSFTARDGLEVDDLYDASQNGWLLFDFAQLQF